MADVTLSRWGKRPYIFINGQLHQSVINELEEELSYEDPDAQWKDAWKSGDWDGKWRLLYTSKNGNRYFPVGLLDQVREVFDVMGVDYEIEGLVRPGRGGLDVAWDTDKTLRDYQQEALDDRLRHGAGLIVLPTGGGKTLIGIRLIYELRQPTIVFCHRQEIADQWVERINDILDIEPAVCYGGTRENGDVMVALYQSIYEEGDIREDVRLDHEVAIFDEAHRVGARTFSDVSLSCNATYRWGLTATPTREDNATLRVIGGTGPLIADLSAEKLIEEGWLAEPEWRIETPHRNRGGSAYRKWEDEYRGEIVENERRNNLIRQVVKELDRPVLITVERINHGERLEGKIDEAVFVHGDSPDRSAHIQAFRDGDLGVLIATRQIVGEGFDHPGLRSMVIAGGLKSKTAMIQQVGRSLRPDTEKATIVDFADSGRWCGQHFEERIRSYRGYYGERYGP